MNNAKKKVERIEHLGRKCTMIQKQTIPIILNINAGKGLSIFDLSWIEAD